MFRNFKLVVFVPDGHLDKLKQAIFSAGAGRQGNYDSCCLLYTSPSPRDRQKSRMPSSA